MKLRKANPQKVGAALPRYSLEHILKQCSARPCRAQKNTAWVADKPVGRELI